MLTSETKRKLTAAGVFALPVVLVWATGEMFGGPSSVQAEVAIPARATSLPVVPDPNTGPIDPAQEAAVLHVAYLLEQPYGPSPLYHVPKGQVTPVNVHTPEVAGAPSFTVNAILGSSRGNTALIDGTSYRVGEALGETGWTITEINAKRRYVTIEDPETARTARRYVDNRIIGGEGEGEDGEDG